ncbi:MAG: hypothetical protein JXB49_18010 [Bacteroidales bacterium]|nr:hypothetical protein [Bacteroidales bacterium]
MKDILISKERVKDFLAERLTFNVLQENEDNLYMIIRNEGLGGFNKMSDQELYENLLMAIPEFQLITLIRGDSTNLIAQVKPEYKDTEEDILIDIHRIIQMKL